MPLNEKQTFFLRNTIRGLIWLGVFVVIYSLFDHWSRGVDMVHKLEPFYKNFYLIIFIFLTSEIIVGIIPPELFIIWALRFETLQLFVLVILLLAVISYLAGFLGYLIGRYLNTTRFYRFIKNRFLRKTEPKLQKFGILLIIVSALTPVPFSGVSMLVGAVKFPIKRYLVVSLTRFLRFLIYAIVFWEASSIS